jgi:hypothetical protein
MTSLRRVVSAAAILALALVAGITGVAAQSDEEFDRIFPFIGHWDPGIANPDGQDRGNCGGRTGDYGEKLTNCSIPADQLPLNARGEAWLKYMDHRQSPTTTECVPIGIPGVLGDGALFISGSPGRLVMEYQQGVTRTIWMNGTGPTPRPGELFQFGYSVGRFDGDDLLIDTTNFAFDPDGMDDHLHMASSVRKKVTERYQLIDDNTLRVIITLDDPTFLTKPFTYAILETKRPGGRNPGLRAACDPEVSRREVEYAYPGNKYPDAKQ